MTLSQLARAIAEQADDPRHIDLSRRPALNAVIECAHLARAISEDEYTALLHMTPMHDFSDFVGPKDDLIQHRGAIADVPDGAFIAIIFVENPNLPEELGMRHLIMPMISLGGGFAACCDPSQIGIGQPQGGWSVVNLLEDLHWLDEEKSNKYDLFNRYRAGEQKSQLLRLRYRMPGRSSTVGASHPGVVTTPDLVWGQPRKSPELLRLITAAAQSVTKIEFEPAIGNSNRPDDAKVERICFKFTLDQGPFELLFNSPNEMRGHYYAGAALGEAYVREMLTAIVEKIDWQKALRNGGRDDYFGRQFSAASREANAEIIRLAKLSVIRGKLWHREGVPTAIRTVWRLGKNGTADIRIPPNARWSPEEAARKGNWNALLADTVAPRQQISETDMEVLTHKFAKRETASNYNAEQGSLYVHSPRDPFAFFFDLDEDERDPANVDVKGEWVNRRGETGDYTPPGKLFRSHQIKWFGFT